jgi:hypothetical protein
MSQKMFLCSILCHKSPKLKFYIKTKKSAFLRLKFRIGKVMTPNSTQTLISILSLWRISAQPDGGVKENRDVDDVGGYVDVFLAK